MKNGTELTPDERYQLQSGQAYCEAIKLLSDVVRTQRKMSVPNLLRVAMAMADAEQAEYEKGLGPGYIK